MDRFVMYAFFGRIAVRHCVRQLLSETRFSFMISRQTTYDDGAGGNSGSEDLAEIRRIVTLIAMAMPSVARQLS